MLPRRHLIVAGLAASVAAPAWAQRIRSLKDPLRLAVDVSLVESGLAPALQRAFGGDTGVAVQITTGAAVALLDALERGEFDAAMTNAPAAELTLDRQGLVHDRQAVAAGGFAIVGPAPKNRKQPDPAGLVAANGVVDALTRIRDQALAAPGTVSFLAVNDGSGLHAAEQALWRLAKIAPQAPWYTPVGSHAELIDKARATGAYAIVERGAWARRAAAPLRAFVDGAPELAEEVHVMRSFRVNHPAAKIFVQWVAGPKGRRVVAGVRGYRAP
jgi:tungstate transport system substrate-binding protein